MKADRIYLKPGEIITAARPTVVTTVLGSCVAVTMFNRRLGIGGICHAMLPWNPPSNTAETFRYVDSSILYMVEEFGRNGIRKDEMEVKLLGGADVLERINGGPESVGQQNIRAAMDVIRKEGLGLAACDVGGDLGRKIVFHIHTGKVFLKRLSKGPSSSSLRSVAGEYMFLGKRRGVAHPRGADGTGVKFPQPGASHE